MSPAPAKGILVLPFSTLKAGAPALAHPSKWHGVVTLTFEEFTYAFVNTFSPEDASAAYERYVCAETGQIFYEAGFDCLLDGSALQERETGTASDRRGRGGQHRSRLAREGRTYSATKSEEARRRGPITSSSTGGRISHMAAPGLAGGGGGDRPTWLGGLVKTM